MGLSFNLSNHANVRRRAAALTAERSFSSLKSLTVLPCYTACRKEEAGATDVRCLGLWNPAFGFDVRPAECALVELYRFFESSKSYNCDAGR